jgi:hypothetical protein
MRIGHSPLHEGVLKGSGRMIVGSVSAEVYRRIEEHVRKGGCGPASSKAETAAATSTMKPASEQTANISAPAPVSREPSGATSAVPASGKPDSVPARETLRVGARVLAAYWSEKREFDGFWLAIIKRIDRDEYTLEWFDAPEYPPFKTRPQYIAVLHPEFRLSGK